MIATEINTVVALLGKLFGIKYSSRRELFDEIIANGEKPAFGLYIDCAGRAATMSNTLTEEASEVQSLCNQHNVPLIGFYSGVEIAPLLGKSRGLDWTGVLLILAER